MVFEEVLTKYVVPTSTVFSNVMIGLVPIIAGWMRYFSTNIKVIGQTSSASVFYGENYSLKLENKTLRNFVVDKINVFINQEQFFTINLEKLDFEKRTLEPFKQLVIREQWTSISEINDKKPLLYGLKFEIFCSHKIITIKSYTLLHRLNCCNIFNWYYRKKEITSIINCLVLSKNLFDGKVISKQVKYALHLFNRDGVFERTILITRHGFMSDSIMGYDHLDRNCMGSMESLEKHIKEDLLKSSGCKFSIQIIDRVR